MIFSKDYQQKSIYSADSAPDVDVHPEVLGLQCFTSGACSLFEAQFLGRFPLQPVKLSPRPQLFVILLMAHLLSPGITITPCEGYYVTRTNPGIALYRDFFGFMKDYREKG